MTKDFTYRVELSGSAALSTKAEYVCNVAKRLFNTIPGTDDYNRDMGLNVNARVRTAQENGRDTDYETRITEQFTTYTDIVPISVIVVFRKRVMHILMDVAYNNERFEMQLGPSGNDVGTLGLQIQPKVIR